MHNGAGALQSIKSYGVLGTMAFALLLSGCGAGSTAATSTGTTTTTTTTPPVSSTPATPATLTGISPGTIMAGTAGNKVTLQGTNINFNATLLIDGTAHAVDYISSTEMDVPLTSADLAAPSRHAFTVQNPQATISGSEALLVTSGYNAFGDSITFGMDLTSPETQNYTALLAAIQARRDKQCPWRRPGMRCFSAAALHERHRLHQSTGRTAINDGRHERR